MSTKSTRPRVVGPDSGPEPPFPLRLSGKVIKGFGRGGRELGVPTANIPVSGLAVGGHEGLESGVYYGWVGLETVEHLQAVSNPGSRRHSGAYTAFHAAGQTLDKLGSVAFGAGTEDGFHMKEKPGHVYPMVMSVGWNPFYKNSKRSVEVHIIHKFNHDFYGVHLNLLMLGFIRPEANYDSKDALVEDIKTDITVTGESLARHKYAEYKHDKHLLLFPEVPDPDEPVEDASAPPTGS